MSTNANLVSLVAGTRLALANSALFSVHPTTNSLGLNPQVWILGVGKVCTLIGPDSTLLEAPTRTGSSEADNSANYYQRYCVSFLVDGPVGSRRASRAPSLPRRADSADRGRPENVQRQLRRSPSPWPVPRFPGDGTFPPCNKPLSASGTP